MTRRHFLSLVLALPAAAASAHASQQPAARRSIACDSKAVPARLPAPRSRSSSPVAGSTAAGRPLRERETVVLVHGLWMHGLEFTAIAASLKRAGHSVRTFPYSDVCQGLTENVERLRAFVQGIPTPHIHFVGHSLGGCLVLEYFRLYPRQKPGRVVAIGSPFLSTWTATEASRIPLMRSMLGRTMNDHLARQAAQAPPLRWAHRDRRLGIIAGTHPFGAGILFGLRSPSDGCVKESETRLPGASDHISLPGSHFGLLAMRETHRQVAHFLQHGAFQRN
ncbi:hypothetical protein DB346_05590 [Verrucomicrobia bacterium LW23]|nr:hypothetical protein DB346_05590 [Verrucomicrobia bacterium LW23]